MAYLQNTGLTITLSRQLVLPTASTSTKSPLQLSDTLTTVSFKAPEYIIPPGVEGVANLVFDVPKHARGVKGGTLQGDESEARTTEAIFEVRCIISVKMGMGLGRFVFLHLDVISSTSEISTQQRHTARPTCSDSSPSCVARASTAWGLYASPGTLYTTFCVPLLPCPRAYLPRSCPIQSVCISCPPHIPNACLH